MKIETYIARSNNNLVGIKGTAETSAVRGTKGSNQLLRKLCCNPYTAVFTLTNGDAAVPAHTLSDVLSYLRR
jgi:hypothetical protein